jgi:hypothetical protein
MRIKKHKVIALIVTATFVASQLHLWAAFAPASAVYLYTNLLVPFLPTHVTLPTSQHGFRSAP